MAGICDHYSIDDLEWLLITIAIALVERYTRPDERYTGPDAAQEFLLTEVAAKHIRYRYHGKLEFDGSAFPESYFWQRNKFVRHEIAASGTVIRTGAALIEARAARRPRSRPPWSYRTGPTRPDENGNERYILDVQRSVTVRMPLVQLHRDDIFRRLREMGFMSASDQTSAQQELPLSAPPPPPPSPPSSEQAKQEESEAEEWLIADVKSHRLPTRKRKISEWCRESHKRMKEAYNENPLYQDPGSLRRALYKLMKKNRIEPI